MSDLIGSRYRILAVLAEDPAAVVWRAYDTVLDREIALKALLAEPDATDDGAMSRFLTEARAAARLHHPNIVTIHDVIADDQNQVFIAMELVDGPTLDQVFGSGQPLPTETVRAVMAQVARALAAAHAAGVVHRALAADKVFWTSDGRAVVTDFGVGETADDGAAAPHDDILAWGTLAYVLATSRAAPDADGPVPELPEDMAFAELIGRCLAHDPRRRPADGTELVKALTAAQDDPAAGRTGPVPTQSRGLAVYLVGAAVSVAGVVVLLVAMGSSPERTPASVTAPSTTAAATTAPPTTTTSIARTTLPVEPGPLSAGPYLTNQLRPTIAFDLGPGWTIDPPAESEDQLVLVRQRPGPSYPWLIFLRVTSIFGYEATPVDAEAPADLADWIRLHPRLAVQQLTTATVGNQPATVIDAEVASAYESPACTRPCVLLFKRLDNRSVRLHEGDRMRIYIVNVGDERLAIVVETPSADSAAQLATAEAVIQSISFS